MRIFTGTALVALAAAGAALADMPAGVVLQLSCDELRDNGTLLPAAPGSNSSGRVTGVRLASGGRLNGCCEFTGKDSFVQVPSAPPLESERVTVGLWLKTDKSEWPERTLVEKQGGAGYALRLQTGKDKERRGKLRATVGNADCVSDMTVADNAWHHAAVTYDGATVRFYVDGVLQKQTAAWRGRVDTKGADLMLGMSRTQSSKNKDIAFEGLLDEVLVFDRALSEAEVKDVIAATKSKFSKQQVERRLRELEELFDRGLLTRAFYDRKVQECEVAP
jgi:hypothetical protein